METYYTLLYIGNGIVEISYGQVLNLTIIKLIMTLVIAIFVVAIITAERLFTYYQLSCVHVNQHVNQTNKEFNFGYHKRK